MSELSYCCVRVLGDRIQTKHYRMPYSFGDREYEIDREKKRSERIENNIEFEKEYKNLKRAQQSVRDIISCNITPHTKFLTLTCKENVLEYKKIKRMFTTFLQAMKREGYVLRYLGVLEHQKGRGLKNGDEGAYHIHLVIFNDEYIPYEIINKHWNGITQIKVLNGLRLKDNTKINSVAWYVCKYITKENYTEYSRHVYFCSNGLFRPEIIHISEDDTDLIKQYQEYINANYNETSNQSYEFSISLKSENPTVLKQMITTKYYEVAK